MGIFDIFNRDKEEYKGYQLSPDVDVTLQKQLIDRGRGSEINSITPEAIKKVNSSNPTANTTPSIINVGKNSLEPVQETSFLKEFGKINQPENFNKEVIEPVADAVFSNPTVQKGLENTVGKLEQVDEAASGKLLDDTGNPILVQDLPMSQQILGSVFHVAKNIGRGELATFESVTNGMQWLGVENAAPVSEKLKMWQDAVAPENANFADNLGAGVGSLASFYLPGVGAMKATEFLGMFSPRVAALFGNSAMTAFEALAEAGDTWKTSKEQGLSEQAASNAATKTFWANAVLIGLTNQFAYFNKVKGLKKFLAGSSMEGLQEFGQQIIQNVNTGKTGSAVFDGALEAGAIGTILGGIFGGIELQGSGIQQIGVKNDIEKTSQVAVPQAFHRVETKDGEKYFETEKEATDYAENNLPSGSYVITEQGSEEALKILETGKYTAFPFENGLSADQIKVDNAVSQIQENAGVDKTTAGEILNAIKTLIRQQGKASQASDELFQSAIDEVKMQHGELPGIITEAINEASKNVIPADKEDVVLPNTIYHQTNADVSSIRENGFQMGKNSVFGEAAFFGEKSNKLYGDNQISVSPSDFKLKTFKTVAQQQDYIKKFGGKNLSEAIRNEGKYDGFIIPNPEGNVVGITNKENLDKKLKSQQFATTEEAKAMSNNFKFIEDLGLPVNVVEKILTPAGKEAFGKYYNGVISFINNPLKTTLPHEAMHAFVDLMLTDKQKQVVLDEVKRRYAGKKFTNQQAEEQLAEDFAKYYIAKFENPAEAKAPTSKLRQFYDWFISQLQKLSGKQDIIAKLYQDIETSRPGIIKKELIRQRLRRGENSIAELQKEYFQNPDALTTKFLENVDVKHREFAGYDFLKNLLKSKSLPLKENERNLIDDILDTQFKGEKKITMSDFRDAVRSELLPLQVIESETYADYGSDNVELSHLDHTTHIYNSPFNHGYTGHFSGDFSVNVLKNTVEIKEIPGKNKWAIVRTGVELNEANIAENVLHIADNQEAAENWIQNRSKSNEMVDVGHTGLFGHTRIWDERNVFTAKITNQNAIDAFNDNKTVYSFDGSSESLMESIEDVNDAIDDHRSFRIENNEAEENPSIRYVAEIQSDAFQNAERILGKTKEINSVKYDIEAIENRIKEYKIELLAENNQQSLITSLNNSIVKETDNLNKRKEKLLALEKELSEENKDEANFFKYKNIWHERLIREEIRRAAMDNVTKLRFPTPYTIAKIEGYLGENGQIPEDTNEGDTFDYGGDDYTLLKNNNDYMGENTGVVVSSSDIRGTWDFDTLRDEDINNLKDEIIYELRNAEDFNQAVDDNSYLTSNLSEEEIKSIKDDYALKQDTDTNIIDDLIDKATEAEIDSRYSDNASYAQYYNDEVFGGDDKTLFDIGDDKVIILQDANSEVMSFGNNNADKENFNYEEDLDGQEQKTVARFYDKQVGRYLSKLRKQNLRTITDENGYDWLETDILPEDKVAVEAFQTKEAAAPLHKSGKEIADYVDEIEMQKEEDEFSEEDGGISDYLRSIIEGQNFTLQTVKIKDLIKRDPDLKIYISTNEQRYPDGVDSFNSLDYPIVVGSWNDGSFGVLDGYNRALTKYRNGDEVIEAWISDSAKYQEMTPSQKADLEYRRNLAAEDLAVNNFEKEEAILAARTADLTFADAEQETGYKNFKKLAARRSWLLDDATDEAMIKEKIDDLYIDDYLFQGAKEITNDELLQKFKDRYFEEQKNAFIARQKTPSEVATTQVKAAKKVIKASTVGRNLTLKNAMNVVKGIEKPITITKKESVLLRDRLKAMAKASKAGYSLGRAEMKADLTLAFAGQLQYSKMIKNAVVAYAKELPIALRGQFLDAAVNANTVKDMAKAFSRIDAALTNADNKNQLAKMKKMAIKVKKAMKSGSGIAVDYQKQIADILNEYNFKNATAATINKLNSLANYIEENPEANIPAHLVKRLDILKRKNPKDITGENLSDLNDLLSRLWSLGELKLAMKGKYNERYIRQSVDKLLSTTVNVDNHTIGGLSWLHAPRVADILDGVRRYKGYNVQLQKQASFAVAKAMQRSTQIIEDTAKLISSIKDDFSLEEQTAMAFKMAVDQKLYSQAQSLLSAHAADFGWKSEADIKITPEMQNIIDILRGTFAQNVDYLAAVYEEIENKPFIKTENYFPNKYDRNFDKTVDLEAPTIGEMQLYQSKQVNKGFTFNRLPNVKKVLRTDIFNVFAEAVSEQQYYMNVQPVLNEIASIVSHKDYQAAVGKVGVQWWDRYLKGVANKGKSLNRGIFDNFLRNTRLNISKAVLGYKLTSALLQPTAIIDAYAYTFLNYSPLVANGLILRLAANLTLPGYNKNIVNKSLGLQLRKGSAGEQVLGEIGADKKTSKIGSALVKAGMYPLRKLDILTAAAVQKTIYKEALRKGMTPGEAQREADFVMNLTQGSSEIGDVPLVLMEGEAYRTLLTFQTFILNRWGIITHDILRSGIIKGNIGRKIKGMIALFLIALAGGVENILRTKIGQVTTGKEYPEKFNFWQQSLLTIPEAVPVIGNILTSTIEYNQGASIPLSRLAENIVKGSKDLISPAGQDQETIDKNRKKGALKLSEAVATYKGVIGAAQAFDFIERAIIPPEEEKATTRTERPKQASGEKRPARPARPSR